MKKFLSSPLFYSIIGAITLVLQQYVGNTKDIDWKVVGMAVLIAILGVVSNYLKGKGSSFLGILGTVGLTFHTIWQTGTFTWNEFILSALLAICLVLYPGNPEPAEPAEK